MFSRLTITCNGVWPLKFTKFTSQPRSIKEFNTSRLELQCSGVPPCFMSCVNSLFGLLTRKSATLPVEEGSTSIIPIGEYVCRNCSICAVNVEAGYV